MKIPQNANYLEDVVDTRPGNYYVSVVDGPQFGLLAGPFPTHAEALAMVNEAQTKAEEVNRKAIWYAYGTVRMADDYNKPGVLNSLLGLAA